MNSKIVSLPFTLDYNNYNIENKDFYYNSQICRTLFDGIYDIHNKCHPSQSILEIYCAKNQNLYSDFIDNDLCECIEKKNQNIYELIIVLILLIILLYFIIRYSYPFLSKLSFINFSL